LSVKIFYLLTENDLLIGDLALDLLYMKRVIFLYNFWYTI